jgi:TP901 family phage tail tape measure protein
MAAISQGQLNFIISMQNQAAAALQQVTQQLQQVGGAAAQTQTNLAGMALAVTGANQAFELMKKAVGEVVDVFHGATDAFSQYEQRMAVVHKVTGLSKDQMGAFEVAFDQMVTRIKGGASVDILGNFAGQAAQLGIRGTADILKFTEVMSKLANTTATIGEQGAKELARVLFVTGEGVDSAEHFASVLTRLGKESAATEGAILHMTTTVAQSVSQFKLGSESLLGLSSAAASLGFQPRLFGTTLSRTLIALRDGAVNSTAAMRDLTSIMGISVEEFQNLIKTDPAEALLRFSEVLQRVNQSGRSTDSFLRGFNLQAQENVRTLGTMSENVDKFRKQLTAARSEKGAESLNQENEVALETFKKKLGSLDNQWTLVKKSFGEALAPGLEAKLLTLGHAVERVRDGFESLSPQGREIVAWAGAATLSLVGLSIAVRSVALAVGLLGGLGGLAGVFSFIGPIFTFVASAIAGLVAAIGFIPIAIAVAVAALTAAAYFIIKNWDAVVAFFKQPIGDIISQSWAGLKDAVMYIINETYTWLKDKWDTVLDIFKKKPADVISDSFNALAGSKNTPRKADGTPDYANPVNISDVLRVQTGMSDANIKVLEQLDKRQKILDTLKKQRLALEQLNSLPDNDRYIKDNNITSFDKQRFMGLQAIEERKADPTADRVFHMKQEVEQAAAVTMAEKNRAELHKEIRDLMEKQGAISNDNLRTITAQVRMLQDARANSALREQVKSYTDEIRQLSIVGDYQDADRKAQQELNQLRDKGVRITEQMAEQAKVYNRAIQDATKSQTSGIEGFAKAVGTVRDNVLDLQKSFASGLSSAITDALTGTAGSFQKFLADFAKQATNMLVNQALKDILSPLGNNLGGLLKGFSSQDALGGAGKAVGALSGLTATSMLVNAGTVTVNSAVGGGGGGLLGLFGGGGSGAPAVPMIGSAGDMAVPTFMHFGGMGGVHGYLQGAYPARLWDHAVRLHSGLMDDEFAAVLKRGERVMTANDNARTMNVLDAAASGGGGGGHQITYAPAFHMDSSGATQQQPATDPGTSARFMRELDNRTRSMFAEFVISESRPGGMLRQNAA